MKRANYEGTNLVGPGGKAYGKWRAARTAAIEKPKRKSKKLPGMPKWTPRSRRPPRMP
jgi:hypothetical protein